MHVKSKKLQSIIHWYGVKRSLPPAQNTTYCLKVSCHIDPYPIPITLPIPLCSTRVGMLIYKILKMHSGAIKWACVLWGLGIQLSFFFKKGKIENTTIFYRVVKFKLNAIFMWKCLLKLRTFSAHCFLIFKAYTERYLVYSDFQEKKSCNMWQDLNLVKIRYEYVMICMSNQLKY